MSDIKPEPNVGGAAPGAAPIPVKSESARKVEAIIAELMKRSDTPQSRLNPEQNLAAPAPEVPPEPLQKVDPILILLAQMQTATASFSAGEAGIVRGISQLSERAATTDATTDATFRTQVAYLFEDSNRVLGANAIEVPPALQAEMTKLAATSPGLTNKAMQAMLQGTADISDRGLVRDLRRAASSMATMGQNQEAAAVGPIIAAFENRVRLAPRDEIAVPQISNQQKAAKAASVPEAVIKTAGPVISDAARAAASPGDFDDRRPSGNDHRVDPPTEVSNQPKRIISQIMSGLTKGSGAGPAPWAAQPVSMEQRMSGLGQRLDAGRTDRLIQSAERSGVAYMNAIETFSVGAGAEILSKIDAAGSTEPGGLTTVMQQMQPGGRYANLRSEFDGALQTDRVFAAAYNQVQKTGQQYGTDRLAVTTDFDARKLDMRQLDARFQKAEEVIGEATERIPGRKPGTNVTDDLGQKINDFLKRAVEKVRSMFNHEAKPDQRSSASPNMGPQ